MTVQDMDGRGRTYLSSVDVAEYVMFLSERFKRTSLHYNLSEMTVELFHRNEPRDLGALVEVAKLRFRIPITKHQNRMDYFACEPNRQWVGNSEPDWLFDGDEMLVELDADESARRRVEEALEVWIDGRNLEIEAGNERLEVAIGPVVRSRRAQLEKEQATSDELLKRLDVPLFRDTRAAAQPIKIEQRPITVPRRAAPQRSYAPSLRPRSPPAHDAKATRHHRGERCPYQRGATSVARAAAPCAGKDRRDNHPDHSVAAVRDIQVAAAVHR